VFSVSNFFSRKAEETFVKNALRGWRKKIMIMTITRCPNCDFLTLSIPDNR